MNKFKKICMNKEELRKQLEELGNSNPQESLRLSGCLIKTIKQEIANSSNKAKKDLLRVELVQSLEKHKIYIEMARGNGKQIQLPKRVGLKVNEIATTIEIFKEKKDVIQKAKNVVTNTGVSAVVVAGITAAFATVGGTLSLATLAGLVPTFCYIGLSNVMREGIKKSEFSKMLETIENKDEIFEEAKQFALDNIVNNKEFTDLLLRKKDATALEEKLEVDKLLIEQYKIIRDKAPNESISRALSIELIELIKEYKKNLEKKKKGYIKDEIVLSGLEFGILEKEILDTSALLFNEENFLGEASKSAWKNIKVNAVTMFLSKMILSGVFPSLAFDSVNDFITPLFHLVINNITHLGDFKDKINMKNTKYVEKQIQFNDPDLFKKLTEGKTMALA